LKTPKRPTGFEDKNATIIALKRGELMRDAAEIPKDEAVKKEWDKLQGTWTILSYMDGRHPLVEMKGAKIKFDGDAPKTAASSPFKASRRVSVFEFALNVLLLAPVPVCG
jgi:hypothetical protein